MNGIKGVVNLSVSVMVVSYNEYECDYHSHHDPCSSAITAFLKKQGAPLKGVQCNATRGAYDPGEQVYI